MAGAIENGYFVKVCKFDADMGVRYAHHCEDVEEILGENIETLIKKYGQCQGLTGQHLDPAGACEAHIGLSGKQIRMPKFLFTKLSEVEVAKLRDERLAAGAAKKKVQDGEKRQRQAALSQKATAHLARHPLPPDISRSFAKDYAKLFSIWPLIDGPGGRRRVRVRFLDVPEALQYAGLVGTISLDAAVKNGYSEVNLPPPTVPATACNVPNELLEVLPALAPVVPSLDAPPCRAREAKPRRSTAPSRRRPGRARKIQHHSLHRQHGRHGHRRRRRRAGQ